MIRWRVEVWRVATRMNPDARFRNCQQTTCPQFENPIAGMRDERQESMLELWIKTKLVATTEQSFKDVVSVMKLLDYGQLDENSYLLLLETGSKINLFNEAKSVFQWYLTSGEMRSQMGEVPTIVNQKLDKCKRLMEKASPGIVTSYCKEL